MRKVFIGWWIAAGCFAGLMIAGCSAKPTSQKLEDGLNLYFAGREECLFPQGVRFPHEVSPGPGSKKAEQQFDALTDAGLLKGLKNQALHVERYTLTPAGERVAPQFCYGHKKAVRVDGFTTPVKDGNVVQSTVTYHAVMRDVPVWAKTDAMKKAFPEMAKDISGPQEGQIVMGTAGVGWRVR